MSVLYIQIAIRHTLELSCIHWSYHAYTGAIMHTLELRGVGYRETSRTRLNHFAVLPVARVEPLSGFASHCVRAVLKRGRARITGIMNDFYSTVRELP